MGWIMRFNWPIAQLLGMIDYNRGMVELQDEILEIAINQYQRADFRKKQCEQRLKELEFLYYCRTGKFPD